MQSKIIGQKENPLFHRKEATVEIEGKGATPRRTEVLAELSEKLGAPSGQIAIAKIDQKFGRHYVIVTARVYESPEFLKKFEHAWVVERGKHKKKGAGEKGKRCQKQLKNWTSKPPRSSATKYINLRAPVQR